MKPADQVKIAALGPLHAGREFEFDGHRYRVVACRGSEVRLEYLGHTTGNMPENEASTPGLTMNERSDRRGALTGRDEAPAVFPVETPEDRERAVAIIEAHRDADPASRIGQVVTVMLARCRAYEADAPDAFGLRHGRVHHEIGNSRPVRPVRAKKAED